MGTMLIRDIPDDTHRQFKARCAMRGMTIKDAMIKIMKDNTESGIAKNNTSTSFSNKKEF